MFDMSEIEHQHQKITDKLMKLDNAVKSHESRKGIRLIFDDVISFTELHFATEERLMVESKFPKTASHMKHHKQLIKEARLIIDKLDDIDEGIFRELFKHWYYANIVTHLLTSDKQLEDHIIQSNRSQDGVLGERD